MMDYLREATLDNVLDRAVFWLNWGTLDFETACLAWNEI